jgi:FG-GAP-like repeat/FG-GAP repeat
MGASSGCSMESTPARWRARRFGATSVLLLLVSAIAAASGGAAPPPIAIVTGQDAGWPDVRGWNADGGQAQQIAPWGYNSIEFSPYSTYQNGVRVAIGDVNGDGKAEIVTAPANGGFSEIRVFDGTTFKQMGAFPPQKDGAWWNGAFVSTGDTNGDGRAEIVEGLDTGCCTMIHVLDGQTGMDSAGFWPWGTNSQAGARVAVADLNGDGKAEILAEPIGTNTVSAFGTGGGNPFRIYQTFGDEALAGATIAAGDVTGDARPELVAAANTGAGIQVKVIDTQSGATLASFFPYGPSTAVATPQISVGDVNGDRRADIVLTASFANGTQVKALDADGRQLGSFFVLEPGIVPGASLAVGDLNGDGKAEIVLGGGPTPAASSPIVNGPDQRVVVYRPDGTLVGGFTAYPGLFQGGVRVALADVEHNGQPDMITAPGPGMEPEVGIYSQRWLQTRDRGTRFADFLAYERSFTGGVSVAAGYWSGQPRIVVAPGPGRAPDVRVFDPRGTLLSSFAAFEPSYTGGLSVAVGDVNGDGTPEIVVGTLASPARIRMFDVNGTPYGSLIGPFPPDGAGVQVGVADLFGSGHGLILAGETSGPNPSLEAIDPATGSIVKSVHPEPNATNGIRIGAGDLNHDGRDEILVTTGWGGDGYIRVLNDQLREKTSFVIYNWPGGGMNIAAPARVGLPLRSDALTVHVQARKRVRIVVARFHDAAGAASTASGFRATIDWGDGTTWRGVVINRGNGNYDVTGTKRYAKRGTRELTVTLADNQYRASIAHSRALVRRAVGK